MSTSLCRIHLPNLGLLLVAIKLQEGSKLKVADIEKFCEGKIARFKIPRIIRLVDEFPMTVTGQVQKYKIREKLIHELGLEAESRSGHRNS